MLQPTLKLLATAVLAAVLAAVLLAGSLLIAAPTAEAKTQPKPSPTPVATATPTPAPAPTFSTPEEPLAYQDEWVELQPQEWHWYAFQYSYNPDDKQAPATLRLDVKPSEQATLLLLNGDQVRAWENGEKLESFGAATSVNDAIPAKMKLGKFCDLNPKDPVCTGNPDRSTSICNNLRNPAAVSETCNFSLYESRGYATWTGTIGASGEYYILVRGDPQVDKAIEYRFTLSGDGLTMK